MERVSALLLSLLCCVCLHTISVQSIESDTFEYDNQTAWPGQCNTNTGRQSPVDIVTANVVEDSSLTALDFSASWGEAVTDGVFANNGHSVVFTLSSDSPSVTTQMPVGTGTYKLIQFHFHWGSSSGTGSEHLIDGQQFELEAHFVHSRVGDGDAGSALAVIGVLMDMSSDTISGVWATLDASQLTQVNGNISITNFTLSDLLPVNKNYYYVPGSLTTPPCTESVQWFVLKNRLTVPSAYLDTLRTIQSNTGSPLTFNFRMPQPLNSRMVSTPGSGMVTTPGSGMVTTPGSSAVITSSSLMAVLLSAILAIAGLH